MIRYLYYEYGKDSKEKIGGSVKDRGDVRNDDQDQGTDAVSLGVG
jgi:hypothetical protein